MGWTRRPRKRLFVMVDLSLDPVNLAVIALSAASSSFYPMTKIQKTLNTKDSRALGYFALCTAITCLFLNALLGYAGGWTTVILAFFGMLSIATIAQADNPNFLPSNRMLMPLLMSGLGLVPALLTFSRWLDTGFSWELDAAGLIIPLIGIYSFAWYVRNTGEPQDAKVKIETGDGNPESRYQM